MSVGCLGISARLIAIRYNICVRKVLIANRGEIARRIITVCHEMGLRTVAVYSEADREAPFVYEADEAYLLGPAPATESYLAIEKILEIAHRSGAEAIHPGYGFLSENPDFAQACESAGIRFIGPRAEVIRLLGDKGRAKEIAQRNGIPTVPGFTPTEPMDAPSLLEQARRIGFPVLLKAVAGGGGKGMRTVWEESEFLPAVESAQREALSAFGDPRLMLERYIPRPRHVEVQIVGDTYGTVIHLFERECSIQRRHQKIFEESPCPVLDPATREALTASAVKLAQAVGYTNAGTVEFLVEEAPDGLRFYFLEVNTRLQVEHPVTEMVTGIDLVHLQLWIAEGHPLPFTQDAIRQRGHAIEARLYAEDPTNAFAPSLGTIMAWELPHLPHVRLDTGVTMGTTITHHYDPMIAKVIAWGTDRTTAIQRLAHALKQTRILGVRTNLGFLIDLLHHPDFVAGRLHTGFLSEHALTGEPTEIPLPVLCALGLAETLARPARQTSVRSDEPVISDPWQTIGAWQLGGS